MSTSGDLRTLLLKIGKTLSIIICRLKIHRESQSLRCTVWYLIMVHSSPFNDALSTAVFVMALREGLGHD